MNSLFNRPTQSNSDLLRFVQQHDPQSSREQVMRMCRERGITDDQLNDMVKWAKGVAQQLGIR